MSVRLALTPQTAKQAVFDVPVQQPTPTQKADYVIHPDFVPNDPSFSKQWALHNIGQAGGTAGADIDAITAWDTERGV